MATKLKGGGALEKDLYWRLPYKDKEKKKISDSIILKLKAMNRQ